MFSPISTAPSLPDRSANPRKLNRLGHQRHFQKIDLASRQITLASLLDVLPQSAQRIRASGKVAADVRRRTVVVNLCRGFPPPHVGGYTLWRLAQRSCGHRRSVLKGEALGSVECSGALLV